LYPLNNGILGLESDRGIVTGKVGGDDTKFEVMFKEQIDKDSIAWESVNIIYVRS
jgi:hypothetical protein